MPTKNYLYRYDTLYIMHAHKIQVPGKTYPLPLKIDTLQKFGNISHTGVHLFKVPPP